MQIKEGNEVIVKLNGREFISYIDNKLVQRFKTNSIVNDIFDEYNVDLNKLYINFQNRKYTEKEWLEFYTMINYSVSGFSSLEDFQDVEIENPLWEERV